MVARNHGRLWYLHARAGSRQQLRVSNDAPPSPTAHSHVVAEDSSLLDLLLVSLRPVSSLVSTTTSRAFHSPPSSVRTNRID